MQHERGNTMTEALTRYQQAEIKFLLTGDLAGLEDDEIAHLYKQLCESRGWDWMTRPFELMKLEDEDDEGNPVTKKEFYPNRQAASLAARDLGLSIEDRGERWDWDNGLYFAMARAVDPKSGRFWDDEGCVSVMYERNGQLEKMWPSKIATLVRKAKTQARRRAILGLSGLARPDAESEMSDVRRASVAPLPSPQASQEAQETRNPAPPTNDTRNATAPVVGVPGQKAARYLTPEDAKKRIGRLEKALREDGYKVQPMRGAVDLGEHLQHLETIAKTRGVSVDESVGGAGAGDAGEYMRY